MSMMQLLVWSLSTDDFLLALLPPTATTTLSPTLLHGVLIPTHDPFLRHWAKLLPWLIVVYR
jgi:hypothetical protein